MTFLTILFGALAGSFWALTVYLATSSDPEYGSLWWLVYLVWGWWTAPTGALLFTVWAFRVMGGKVKSSGWNLLCLPAGLISWLLTIFGVGLLLESGAVLF